MLKSGIYKIVNLVNNKIYIGKSKNLQNRRKEHFGDLKKGEHNNCHLQSSWNKYGPDVFAFEIIEFTDISLLFAREHYWIHFYNTLNRNFGYNIEDVDPEQESKIVSEETREKIRLSKIGKKLPSRSQEYKNAVSLRMKGKAKTEEHCRKISEAKTGSTYDEDFKQKRKDYMTGKTGINSTAGKEYSLISPNGELVTFKSMANFCKENDLDKRSVFALLKGGRTIKGRFKKTKQVKGWTNTEAKLIESCIK